MKPTSVKYWNCCQNTARENNQMKIVRTESRTIRVVADISLVTETPAKLKNREIWLAETLVELADTAVAGFEDAAYLATLTGRLAELLAPAEIGLIIAEQHAGARVAAATSERIGDLLSFELAHGEGPCVACYLSGQRILNHDIGIGDERWSRYAAKAQADGFRFASALPMRRHDDVIGAVGILDVQGRPFSDTDISLAQTLAEAATTANGRR